MMLPIRSYHVLVEDLEVEADVGFHDKEVGVPQRLLVTVEASLDPAHIPEGDDPAQVFDYDPLLKLVRRMIAARRYNLQETLAADLFRALSEVPGVRALTVITRKPDIYPDARAAGVMLSSLPAASGLRATAVAEGSAEGGVVAKQARVRGDGGGWS
jgi:dihydroneopterin aldolase